MDLNFKCLIETIIFPNSKLYNYLNYWKEQGINSEGIFTLGWINEQMDVYLENCWRKYGKVYGSFTFGKRTLITNDAKIAKEISIKEFHKFPLRYSFHIGSSNLNKSLFFMQANEDWKRVRSIVTPAFTSGKLKGMLHPIEKLVENFIHHLEQFSENGVCNLKFKKSL